MLYRFDATDNVRTVAGIPLKYDSWLRFLNFPTPIRLIIPTERRERLYSQLQTIQFRQKLFEPRNTLKVFLTEVNHG